MKKRILSVLLCLCMVMALLPTTALATVPSTAPTEVYICGMTLTDGKCLASNTATSATDYTGGNDYVALYQDGILHLKGLDKSYAGEAGGNRALNWNYSRNGAHDLVIELAEGSVNKLVDTNYGAINGASGYGSDGPSLTIQGKGTLNVTGKTNGIWVWTDVVIQDGATVNVTGNGTTNSGSTHHAGICTNASSHGLTIKQGTNVTISGEGFGVSADNSATGLFTVLGGNLVIRGKTAALHKLASNFAGNTVYVSNNFDGSGETAWDNTTDLTSYKYIRLSGFGGATTYNVATDTTSTTNGSFAVDYTKSMAGETVTITATPDSGYEVNTVTVTDTETGTDISDTVNVDGTGNTRTFTMPEKNVTVTVTFKPTTYTITYNLNGGTNAVTNPATYTVETDDITLASPTRSGYTFGGWFNNSGLTGSAVTTIARGSTGNKTFWAKWTENQVTGTTYTYAYDAQRSPGFPTSVGAAITATPSTDSRPLKSDESRYSSSAGTWTLTKVGYYADKNSFSPAPTSYLDGVVTAVATQYGLDDAGKNGLAIHKLTDAEGTHVAYGVLIAVDETNDYALFVGDLWNSSGAGYLLSKNAVSVNSVTFNAQQTAQSKYSISLSPATVTFTEAQTGYTVPAAQTITVTNTGDDATGGLTVALSGDNADSYFTLNKTSINSITATNGAANFTVQPKPGLAAGTYTATVTVSGNKVMPVTATVSFTVTKADQSAPAAPTMASKTSSSVTLNAITTTGYGTVEYAKNTTDVAPADVWQAGTEFTGLSANTTYYFFARYAGNANYNSAASTSTAITTDSAPYIGGGSYTPPSYKVESEVSKDTDGTLSSDHSTAKAGDKVTIKVTPDRYYKVDGVVVKDQNGKKITVTENADGTFTFKMPASKVTVEPVFSWDNPFADVVENAYYASAVEWALKNDVTGGTTATTFSPNAGCTRAQIVTFLWRVAGCPEPASTNSFTDVSADAYYAKAVAWAVEQGITSGTGGGKFSPGALCTRGQSMAFLYRAAGSPEVFDDISFTDVSTGSYYADAVAWAAQNGITSGNGNGTFSPGSDCTRAQIMTFLYRWMVK